MKLTRHNGRSGKHGTYNPKHNDRSFDVANSEHIDEERAKHNVYWDCFNGYRTFAEKQVQSELADTFEEVEELFYSAKYDAYVEAQNARNDKNRHSERNRTTTDLLKDKRTCPEETMDCQHFFRQIFLGYFSDIVQAFDTLRKNVCGDDYTSLHNPIVLSSVLPAYGMFHSIQILFL